MTQSHLQDFWETWLERLKAVKIGRRKCLKMGSPFKDPPPPNRGSNLYQMRSGKEAACSKSDLDELVCEWEKSKVGVR